ncbi:hypothetical protein WI75_22670 [Burkholderia ubonensis]|nr:hypothetical protein WI75_22670 [Burkholderia ubonensis]KWC22195.1 hypothetical protein WL48_32710 [Burkholderia ubonensis]KWC49299.1 hypothetical protein WL49_09530 [Burkholderia ubonensis]
MRSAAGLPRISAGVRPYDGRFAPFSLAVLLFTADELNEKSRAAILRLGAKQEGIVRHERIMPDGRKRNSVRFSIIDDEWPGVKARLQERLAR